MQFEDDFKPSITQQFQHLQEQKSQKVFERLINEKYRLKREELGASHMAEHFIKELQQPITIKQEEISRDLYRFVEQFPVDLIPFKSENEVQIENIVKRIKKLQAKKISQSQILKQIEEEAQK